MRLKLKQPNTTVHTDLVAALGWNVWNELFTCSDDKSIYRWNMLGEPESKICQLETYFTDLHWYPVSSKKNQSGGTDVYAVACTDGSVKIMTRAGRLEKSVEAHKGACIALKWSYDGTALATAGEDGFVKIWSRNGMLRSTLSQSDSPVYCVVWSYDCDQLCYCTGSNISMKSLATSSKTLTWKAHDGVVLKVDWSPINHYIVSGGEDCKYKVWDNFGRLIYQSNIFDYAVTSVAWSPSGELFAVGTFNTVQLCDRMGWAHSKSHLADCGSVLALSWTADGTQLAGAGGNGALVVGQVVDMSYEDGKVQVVVEDDHRIVVNDIVNENSEELSDFRDRIVKVSLSFGYLIVCTATQCHVFNTGNLSTPHIFDLKDSVTLILQAERHFMLVDSSSGVHLYTYDGRQICNPKFAGLRTELLNSDTISLSNDVIAILDLQLGAATVRFFDTAQGRPLGEPYTHSMDITQVALSQAGTLQDRHVIFVDRNRDLYLMPVLRRGGGGGGGGNNNNINNNTNNNINSTNFCRKLAAMVDGGVWHDTTGMLAAVVDKRLVVWYQPIEIFNDRGLLDRTKYVKTDSDFGKQAQVKLFSGSKCLVRLSDGVLVGAATSPYPILLYDLVRRQLWDKARRLCRFVKDPTMWATLAVMAMASKELNAAEDAFAAIDEVDKTHFIKKVKLIPSEEGRNAELALYRRRPEEAESILLQAGLIYRAIKMNAKLFNWDRALDLAQQQKQHIDTVLYYRQNYLKLANQSETNARFMQLANQMSVNVEDVKRRIQDEKVKEAQRPGARRYT